ncbi:hypothetical protein SAMN03159343_0895 [Klenkia marina]|uniref:Uncharacterized protein n=1 Tax=Klenkia marina TaxID=1960309 RepID=A0A1G4XGK2_9ACTN|nr:hypothetical protein SAMN03159343_0895 [Klenkia marina]
MAATGAKETGAEETGAEETGAATAGAAGGDVVVVGDAVAAAGWAASGEPVVVPAVVELPPVAAAAVIRPVAGVDDGAVLDGAVPVTPRAGDVLPWTSVPGVVVTDVVPAADAAPAAVVVPCCARCPANASTCTWARVWTGCTAA